MHPQGVHAATVLDHGLSYTGNENLQVIALFETEHGTIFGYFVITDAAAKYTIDKLRAMGFIGNDFADLNKEGLLNGNQCDITVEHEEYGGQTRAKISWVNRLGEGEGGPIEKDANAAKNAKRFNAMLKKTKPGKPAPKKTDDGDGPSEEDLEAFDGDGSREPGEDDGCPL